MRGEARKGALAHEDHGGSLRIGQSGKVQVGRQVARHVMAGDELHAPGGQPAGQGNAGGGGGGRGRGDAGDDLVVDTSGAAGVKLFFQATEKASIAGFQPHHPGAGQGVIDQKLADASLFGRRAPCPFAHTDKVGARTGMAKDRTGGQVVEKHRIGGLQAVDGLERQ